MSYSSETPFCDKHQMHIGPFGCPECKRPAAPTERELLPCPWCGTVPPEAEEDSDSFLWWIWCQHLDCKVQPTTGGQDTKEQAIATWNTRHLAERPGDAVAKLVCNQCGGPVRVTPGGLIVSATPAEPARGTVEVEPTEAMLIAARDWSDKKFGRPIGNDAAIGCWKAMLAARNG